MYGLCTAIDLLGFNIPIQAGSLERLCATQHIWIMVEIHIWQQR